MKYIDIRVEVSEDVLRQQVSAQSIHEQGIVTVAEEGLLSCMLADIPFVTSGVILRNNGFAHLLPDESTRMER